MPTNRTAASGRTSTPTDKGIQPREARPREHYIRSMNFLQKLPLTLCLFVTASHHLAADPGEAVGQPAWTWSTGGDAPWFAQGETFVDGTEAAQSGPVSDEQSSWLETTLEGPGTLEFSWKVSSEWHYDTLDFSINGSSRIRTSGEEDWDVRSVTLPPGTHDLRWTFRKNASLSHGDDAAWLDQVVWYPQTDYILPEFAFHRLSPTAQSYLVAIESDTSWSVDYHPEWINVTPESGVGDEPITVEVSANPGISSRRGRIVFNGASHRISQAARPGQRFAVRNFEEQSGGNAALQFLAEEGLRYTAQSSDDLRTWNNAVFMLDGSETSSMEVFETAEVQLEVQPDQDPGSNAQFWRIHAQTPPLNFSLIPGGFFEMGDSYAENEVWMNDSRPVHQANTQDFHISPTPVTYGEWQEVYDWAIQNGYTFEGPGQRGSDADWNELPASPENNDHPVVAITWYDAVKWCNAKSEKSGRAPIYFTDNELEQVYRTGHHDVTPDQVDATGSGYRLPTEAEWEKAARGGRTGKRWPWGDEEIDGTRANFLDSSDANGTTPVATYPTNNYDLYDMAGNVWEWTYDWHDANRYRKAAEETAPQEVAEGSHRVARGGSWDSLPEFCRVSHRLPSQPGTANALQGFRLVFNAPPGGAAAPGGPSNPPDEDLSPPPPSD